MANIVEKLKNGKPNGYQIALAKKPLENICKLKAKDSMDIKYMKDKIIITKSKE